MNSTTITSYKLYKHMTMILRTSFYSFFLAMHVSKMVNISCVQFSGMVSMPTAICRQAKSLANF